MEINVRVNSFVKLLLVITFFIHVSTATASSIDDQYVAFHKHRITFFDKDGTVEADLWCSSGHIDIKIGQEVKINSIVPVGSLGSFQRTVKLINGYQISFNYKDTERELTFTIEPSSSPVPELKRAGRDMVDKVREAMDHSLVSSLNLKQVKVEMPQGCLDDSDKAIYTSSFNYGNTDFYHMYARCYRDHYMVLVVRKDLNPFAANGDLLLPGSKVVIGASISIGFFAVVYYRMTKRRSPTTKATEKGQTGRNSSQSKGNRPAASLPRKKVHESAHKVLKTKK